MTISTEFREQLVAAIPGLRAFGLSLTARNDRADDLVQETLMKAWKHYDSFQPGTNMKAWLYTILRNEFYTQLRKRKREVEDADGVYSGRVAVHAALLSLQARDRGVVVLGHHLRCSERARAGAVGLPPSADPSNPGLVFSHIP